jgi:hypothetical protein
MRRTDGPITNPVKCPIADDGDDGTVHGLTHTKINPKNNNNLPEFFLKLSLEESVIHAPSAIIDIGSQKNTTAFNISSINHPKQTN